MSVCPICNSALVEPFIEFKSIPVTQNMLYKTKDESIRAMCKDIRLAYCKICGFVFSLDFTQSDIEYSEDYNNDQRMSKLFTQYYNSQIAWLKNNYININDTIAEIGCGKGYYINRLAQVIGGKGNKYGFDTTYDGKINSLEGVRFYKNYFSEEFNNLNIDFAICRHVIEHIQKPVDFLKLIRGSIKENALLFIETPDFNWIIENTIFFDLNSEHCSYFTENSLSRVLQLANFKIIETMSGFDGQYMWFVAQASENADIKWDSKIYSVDKYKKFQHESEIARDKYINLFKKHKKNKKTTAIWGAGAKGNVLLNLIDKEHTLINYVIDIHNEKKYKYVGGTGHQVIPPSDIEKNDISDILVLNPNYYNEICGEVSQIMDITKLNIFM